MIIEKRDELSAYLCSSSEEAATLMSSSKKFSHDREFILLLDNKKGIIDNLLPAYLNAYIRYKENNTRTKSLGMEVLLFISRTMNINKAIKEQGLRDSNAFILFSNNDEATKKFLSKLEISVIKKYRLRLDKKTSGSIAITDLAGN